MKKAIMTVTIAAALLGSCKAQLPQKLQEQIDAKPVSYTHLDVYKRQGIF